MTAASRLLVSGGIEAVTHQSVAAEAGMGRATIYRHWPRPLDLLLATLEHTTAPLFNLGDGEIQGELVSSFKARIAWFNQPVASVALGAVIGRADHEPAINSLRKRTVARDTELVALRLKEAAGRGELNADIPAHTVATMIIGAILYERHLLGTQLTSEIVEQIIAAALAGWLTRKATNSNASSPSKSRAAPRRAARFERPATPTPLPTVRTQRAPRSSKLDDTGLSKRDINHRNARLALMDAGEKLFSVRPMEAVSIDEIVNAASVSKGGFYNHFDSKEQLAAAIVALIQGDLEHHIQRTNADIDDPAERIVRALGVVLRYGLSHPERVQAILSLSERQTTAMSPLNGGVTADILAGLDSDRFCRIDLESGVLLVLGIFIATMRHVASGLSADSTTTLVQRMGTAALRALGVEYEEAKKVALTATEAFMLAPASP